MEELLRDPRWTFPLSYWKKSSPSRLDGVEFNEELIGQSKGVQFVTRMATQLRLPAQTIFASTLYLHRFYTRNSLKRLHPYQIAAACVFLACKTEESPRKLKDVAIVTTKAALKLTKNMADIEKEHKNDVEQWAKVIPSREDELLQALKFDFGKTAPYEDLSELMHKYVSAGHHQVIGPLATAFINDSCRTLLSVEVTMKEMAIVAIYWASKSSSTQIPDSDGMKWYMKENMSRSAIVQAINDMIDMINTVRAGVLDGQKYERLQ